MERRRLEKRDVEDSRGKMKEIEGQKKKIKSLTGGHVSAEIAWNTSRLICVLIESGHSIRKHP